MRHWRCGDISLNMGARDKSEPLILAQETVTTPRLFASDDAMTLDDYFRFIVQALRARCTYSVARKAWEISGLEAEILFLEYSNRWPSELASPEDAFQEGERRGFWTRDIGDHFKTDTLVMK